MLKVAEVELLPGECVQADAKARGGALRVETRDPRDQRRRAWVSIRRGRVTWLAIDERGRVDAERQRCTISPD